MLLIGIRMSIGIWIHRVNHTNHIFQVTTSLDMSKDITMITNIASITFHDEESNSETFAAIRLCDGKVALSLSSEENGDVDTLMNKEVAKEIADAIYQALKAKGG